MIQTKKWLSPLLFLVVVLGILVGIALTTSTNFTVLAGEEETRRIDLAVEDRVVIKFAVVGQTTHTLNFYVTYPNGTARDFGKVGSLNYPFVCDSAGEHVLHFSNVESTENKFVTLNYEIEHYLFGIPQMLFLTIVIVLVCVAAVAAFIFMGKTH